VFNASNREVDIEVFAAERDRLGLQVALVDRTLETALIGLQGPHAQAILSTLTPVDLEALAGYAFATATAAGRPAAVAGARAFVSRTGYTGEDGFELMVEAADAERVWSALQEGGASPAGLGARDTLRTEAGFALYGHDIDRTTNPYEARLGWVVNLDKPSFIGREALAQIKAAGPTRRIVGLRVAPGAVPRQGVPILEHGEPVGQVTSGTFSPTLKQNIAMGYVPVNLSQKGLALSVEMRGKQAAAEVVSLPFVAHRSRPRAKM
ncbi:MAG TPA: glycine cleavage T C-terminal barrel domain-containing protein, partial [Chloroflexota bacterium]|nr:glycine cleavage T C-terminal barrel domain-containing protein [Chloroflexota bacterium]